MVNGGGCSAVLADVDLSFTSLVSSNAEVHWRVESPEAGPKKASSG